MKMSQDAKIVGFYCEKYHADQVIEKVGQNDPAFELQCH